MSDDLQSFVDDLRAIGLTVQTFGFGEQPEMPQLDKDFFAVRDFLEFCIRLTGERLRVNPSVAAHFRFLHVPLNLYETSEFAYHGMSKLTFNR